MRLILNKKNLSDNPVQLLRRAGYAFWRQAGDEMSFVRPLVASGYPRFHAYVKETGEELIVNLHLDQKRPSYAGGAAHSGEYDGGVLGGEAARLKKLFGLR